MEARSKIRETKEAEQSADTEKKKMTSSGDESSIFASILADIEENPMILLKKQRNLSSESSIFHMLSKNTDAFSCTVSKTLTHSNSDVDISSPTIQQNKKKKNSSLTRSDMVELLNQELEILKSEIKIKEQRKEVVFLADEVLEWISKGDEKSEISTDDTNADDIDEFIEEMLEKVENDGSYLEKIKDEFEFGEFLEGLLRDRLREKEEKEIASWIRNGELEAETGVSDKQKMKKKKKSPVKRTEQESTLAKRDYSTYRRRMYLIEKLRELDENKRKRKMRAARFGVELSFLVAEHMFLIPNEHLATRIEDYWMCLKRLGVDKEDKGTSIIIEKLEEVFEIVKKSKNKEYDHNVNVPESLFGFDEFVLLCTDVIPVLGKIVWALRRIGSEGVKVSELDSWFEHCENVLVKIELKLAEMKQWVYRLVSADYESFSKSARFDSLLKEKIMKRVNADNGFGRGVIHSYLVEIWNSLF